VIFSIIKNNYIEFGVSFLCDYFGVSRSGYYDYVERGESHVNSYQAQRIDLEDLVTEIHRKSPSRGYRKINDKILRETGLVVTNWLVHKVCKSLNIKSKAGTYKHKKDEGEEHVKFPRIITNWTATRPFEKVASDTTIIRHNGVKYDFTYYIDAYNNEIIGYDICPYYYGVSFEHHIRALNNFLENKIKRGYIDLETILHTDQGTIYTSRAFENAHANYTITRSMSRAATPKDNGLIESTNRWIKVELKYDFNTVDYNSVYELIDDYVYYFNNDRGIHKLNNKSPIEFRSQ
jgi:transposase InsO family protein